MDGLNDTNPTTSNPVLLTQTKVNGSGFEFDFFPVGGGTILHLDSQYTRTLHSWKKAELKLFLFL